MYRMKDSWWKSLIRTSRKITVLILIWLAIMQCVCHSRPPIKDKFIVVTTASIFPILRLITGFLRRVTHRVQLALQEFLPFNKARVVQSLVLCVLFCQQLRLFFFVYFVLFVDIDFWAMKKTDFQVRMHMSNSVTFTFPQSLGFGFVL